MDAAVVVAFLAVAGHAAADSALEQAKALTSTGEVQFKLAHFQDAVEAFSKAYEKYPTPTLLYDIGQCHRMLKNHERAVFFFEGYLRDKPDAPNRALVEQLIGESKAELQKQAAAAPPPPPGPQNVDGSRPPGPPPAEATGSRSQVLQIVGLTAAGVGVVLVATGAYFGVKASSDANDVSTLSTQHGTWSAAYQAEQSNGQTAASAATALLLVGSAAIVGGGVLAFLGWPRSESRPTLTVAPAPGGACLGLAGRF